VRPDHYVYAVADSAAGLDAELDTLAGAWGGMQARQVA
jgi:hypothetical protein